MNKTIRIHFDVDVYPLDTVNYIDVTEEKYSVQNRFKDGLLVDVKPRNNPNLIYSKGNPVKLTILQLLFLAY